MPVVTPITFLPIDTNLDHHQLLFEDFIFPAIKRFCFATDHFSTPQFSIMKFGTRVLIFFLLQPIDGFFVESPLTRPRLATSLESSSSYFDDVMGNSVSLGDAIDRRPSDSFRNGPLSKARIPSIKNIWREETTALIQGSTLRTWPLSTEMIDMVQISMATEGRPLNANVELWQGPDYTPSSMKIYSEDGNLRPVNAVVLTPSASNTIAIYNTGNLEFPIFAAVEEKIEPGLAAASDNPFDWSSPTTVQGGALKTWPFDPAVQSVQILLNTDGRNLKARIELMQGPNNDKQIVEFYSSDGMKRPIYIVIETPGTGNVVRVINQNPVEFPFTAFVGPFEVDARMEN